MTHSSSPGLPCTCQSHLKDCQGLSLDALQMYYSSTRNLHTNWLQPNKPERAAQEEG